MTGGVVLIRVRDLGKGLGLKLRQKTKLLPRKLTLWELSRVWQAYSPGIPRGHPRKWHSQTAESMRNQASIHSIRPGIWKLQLWMSPYLSPTVAAHQSRGSQFLFGLLCRLLFSKSHLCFWSQNCRRRLAHRGIRMEARCQACFGSQSQRLGLGSNFQW